ncbi:uncharacterized protein LOC130797514 [Amaranthus tricolor]|uniref:uncharacterized protein LOC130797514 n=1 Tax=Amaranthus tricolor TaxID=29722 RepID=UPI002589DA73|nr:uncharacterized protein LOC130797514 [Amaranthus tricolor]
MNRLTSLAALRRAAAAASLTPTRSLQQTAPFTTSSTSQRLPWRLGDHFGSASSNRIAGTMFFSVAAATSLCQEAKAKEPIQSMFKDVVLYQYEACPFCNKVKAFLDYYNIPYKVVEVNPISKKEIKWSEYKKVPILTVEGELMVNSSDIIDTLYKRMHSEGSTHSSVNTEEEKKWLGWVDNHLVHVLSPNIYRSAGEALESFDYIANHGNFGFMERIMAKYAGATAMYFVSKKLKKKYNITDERESLYQAAETWVDALKDRPFLGGSKPNLADLAVFGVLRPIRNLQSGRDMVEHTRIGEWYSRMEKMVGESCRVAA